MIDNKFHRLLKRQIRKHKLTSADVERLSGFLESVNCSYHSSQEDLLTLENIIEISSAELYTANAQLKEENTQKSIEAMEAKLRLDNVVNNLSDIIFEMDKFGNFTYLNSSWIKYGEELPEASIGKNFMEFAKGIVSFESEVLKEILNRNFSKDIFKTVFGRKSNGLLKWWEMSVKIVRYNDGTVKGAIGSLNNITYLKEVEKELIEANKSKSRFLSTMSHEIRTPLNAVIALSNILLRKDPKPEQIENLETLSFSSKNLLVLINDILDYNKLHVGKLNFEKKDFSLEKVISSIVRSHEILAQERLNTLRIEIDEQVPSYVIGDSARLTQVITNLVNNAIKFTFDGDIIVSVKLESSNSSHSKIRFSVTDEGIGIKEDKFDLIFERFAQAEDDTTKKYGGTGLGLAICKKIVNLLGGEIDVDSTIGQGTTFSFDIEYLNSEKKNTPTSSEANVKIESLAGMRLLVVDDNKINLMVVTQFFEEWGVSYQEAISGQEAINYTQNEDFDLVLMDLQMPEMDGYTASKKIRAFGGKFEKLPIIALSASISSDVRSKVQTAGMNGYLSKPFNPTDLFNELKSYHKVLTLN